MYLTKLQKTKLKEETALKQFRWIATDLGGEVAEET